MIAMWRLGGFAWLAAACWAAAPRPATSAERAAVPAAEAARDRDAVSLPTALEWTLQRNPQLAALRRERGVSAAALAVARRLPADFNPTVSVDVRPWTFDGATAEPLKTVVSVSWVQPLPVGGRTGRRVEVARAAFRLTDWRILQAELQALTATYRLYQTAAYRREKLALAAELVRFNGELAEALQRQVAAGQAPPGDGVLAEVEREASRQAVQVAEQEYLDALTELRIQLGTPEAADRLVPADPLRLPPADLEEADLESLVDLALASRADILAAQAQAAASRAAVELARAERLPVPEMGPVYEHDESGTTFYGLTVAMPVPVWNAGWTIVRQREAEYARDAARLKQLRIQAAAEVNAAWARWRGTIERFEAAAGTVEAIQERADRLEQLYRGGQADFITWLSVRRSLIQAQSVRLDMMWRATQAYAELLAATGASPLLDLAVPEPGGGSSG